MVPSPKVRPRWNERAHQVLRGIGRVGGPHAQLTRTLAVIRRSQGEDRRPQASVGQVQTDRYDDSYQRRLWGDGTTQRINQVCPPVARLATPVNGLRSTLEEIEKRSQALLEKAKAPRFVDKAVLFIDKGRDSGEVVKLVERLRDAITRYQVSEGRFIVSNTTYTAGRFHNSKQSMTNSKRSMANTKRSMTNSKQLMTKSQTSL